MKISTNNLSDFKENTITKIIEEQKSSKCYIEIPPVAANANRNKFDLKKLNISQTKTNFESDTHRSIDRLINSQDLNEEKSETENEKENANAFSMKSLKKLVNENEETVKNTLPGLIISLVLKNKYSVNEDFLINCISPIIGNLRKPDGSKYRVLFLFLILILIIIIIFVLFYFSSYQVKN